jgi:hypothetical protein
MVMYVYVGSVHLPYSEPTSSETTIQLSQCWVRLHVDWVDAVWDQVNWVNTECAGNYKDFIILHWLGWCRVSLRVDLTKLTWSIVSIDREWGSTSTESPPNNKNLKRSVISRIKQIKTRKPFSFGLQYISLICVKNYVKENFYASVPLK